MVEAMPRGGHNRHGRLFAPADALDDEPVIFSYLKERLDGVEIILDRQLFSPILRHQNQRSVRVKVELCVWIVEAAKPVQLMTEKYL